MKTLCVLALAFLLAVPAAAASSGFATRLAWYSDGPGYDCRPACRSWGGWWHPCRWGGSCGRYVPVEKRESVLSELRRKEAQEQQARIEKAKGYNEKYKELHGEYPVPQVVFSPNHPAAR